MNSHDITIQFSNCLVVWNMNFIFPIILGRIIPTDYVSEGLKPPTRGIEISGFYENVTVLSLDVIKIYIYTTYIYIYYIHIYYIYIYTTYIYILHIIYIHV